jgi:hypothetical protein
MRQAKHRANVLSPQKNPQPAEPASLSATLPAFPAPHSDRSRRYYPELAEWNHPSQARKSGDPTHEFRICEQLPDGRKCHVATITVNAGFSAENAERIAALMASSGELWRMLQRVAGYLDETHDSLDDLFDAAYLLFASAGRSPFRMASINHDDEAMCKKWNAVAMPAPIDSGK